MKAGVQKLYQPGSATLHAFIEPYVALMRIDRPVGTLLLLWPTLAALWLAADGLPPLSLIAVFIAGTWLMRSAGCVINDIADRRFDGHVRRTAGRPLATGRVATRSAVFLFIILILLAASLLLFLNPLTRLLAVAGLGIAAIYPLMKRWTYLPQVVLGAAFSWGLVMAYASVRGTLSVEAWLLFIASMTWIVAYDTMYAMVDRADDVKIGIRSTAILFGTHDRLMIGALQVVTLIALTLFAQVSGARLGLQAAITVMAGLFVYQQYLIRNRQPAACFQAFRNNVWAGFALFAGALLDAHLLPLLTGMSFFGTTL